MKSIEQLLIDGVFQFFYFLIPVSAEMALCLRQLLPFSSVLGHRFSCLRVRGLQRLRQPCTARVDAAPLAAHDPMIILLFPLRTLATAKDDHPCQAGGGGTRTARTAGGGWCERPRKSGGGGLKGGGGWACAASARRLWDGTPFTQRQAWARRGAGGWAAIAPSWRSGASSLGPPTTPTLHCTGAIGVNVGKEGVAPLSASVRCGCGTAVRGSGGVRGMATAGAGWPRRDGGDRGACDTANEESKHDLPSRSATRPP